MSIYNNVANIWLEFDVDNHSSTAPEPSFFFAPRNIKGTEKPFLSKNNWVINDTLKLLFGSLPSNEVQQQLLNCFNSLPSHGEIFQIGVMLPRKTECYSVRLCVQGISHEEILDYLSNIGWSSSLTELSNLLSQLSQFVDVIRLNFGVKDSLYPKIGLECYIDKQPKNTAKWQLFFDYLVKNKLCTPEKAYAILNWTGYTEEKFCPEIWPSNFAQGSALVSPKMRSTIARTLHHIKIVYQPHQPLQAKAYLWFSHRWLSQNGLFQL
ncbi:hypothetical protein [Nostoc sp.]